MTPIARDDPIAQLRADRAEASAREDPMASLCMLASVGGGEPRVRTLVLARPERHRRPGIRPRRIRGHRVRLVPQPHESQVPRVRRVRLRRATRLPAEPGRPIPPSVLSAAAARTDRARKLAAATLRSETHGLALRTVSPERRHRISGGACANSCRDSDPTDAPATAVGFMLNTDSVERLDLAQEDGIHDRRRYTVDGDGWVEEILVP